MTAGTSCRLLETLDAAVRAELDTWRAGDKVQRLWARDASLWTGADEASYLGIPGEELARAGELSDFAAEVRAAGFTHAVVLGMGGSSLCPEVLKTTFGRLAGHPELFVLDSTDPGQILALERRIDPTNTLFFVSSKSGTTLEPNIFMQYFFERAQKLVGADRAGRRFVAITDPGSKLEQVAKAQRFRACIWEET
jgi:glucose-6-phosphate isomerase